MFYYLAFCFSFFFLLFLAILFYDSCKYATPDHRRRAATHRYDALGDSPGAQGPSSQGPRSPSVYSHFSQSVFSQSAYGPSAYGPSQRRQGGPGSIYSQYEASSSHNGGSQYPGPVPSHLGASQLSSERTSYHASNAGSGGGSGGGIAAGVNPGAARGELHGNRQV